MQKLALSLIGLAAAASALAAEPPDPDLLAFFAGRYDVVGRAHDSRATYSGTVEVSVDGSRLRIDRSIAGAPSAGSARLEPKTADAIPTLAMDFTQGAQALEATCLFSSDLDNDPRITCLTRQKGVATDAPGLEAWFKRKHGKESR